MPDVFFSSDHHFGHANILRYCKRPFEDVEQMNREFVERWNATVGLWDVVFYLGDFAFMRPADAGVLLSRLNGRKHLVRGNHDEQGRKAPGWETVIPESGIGLVLGGQKLMLTHYPQEPEDIPEGVLSLHGHSHGNLPDTRKSVDIGVDCWDFRPVRLSQVVERVARAAG